MKKMFYLLIAVCCHGTTNAQTIFEKIKDNIGLLQYSYMDSSDKMTSIGTGTILCKQTKDNQGNAFVFLVTNKHVLPSFKKSRYIEFIITNPDTSIARFTRLRIPVYDKNGKYDPHVLVSTEEDVAILEIGKAYAETGFNLIPGRHIPVEWLATPQILREKRIGIGDLVFFQGYPSFFYEEDNYSSVFRTGYLATDPSKPYHFNQFLRNYFGRDILNGFLIDANVFGGSSGSLVCLYPTLTGQSNALHPELVTGKGDPWILGILTESYYDIGTEGVSSQRLNIGGVISSEKILELINLYKPPAAR
jgi:hypothetical protein